MAAKAGRCLLGLAEVGSISAEALGAIGEGKVRDLDAESRGEGASNVGKLGDGSPAGEVFERWRGEAGAVASVRLGVGGKRLKDGELTCLGEPTRGGGARTTGCSSF